MSELSCWSASPRELPNAAVAAGRRGFTLIELLTVIAIIGILAAIIIPVTGKVRASARSTNCTSNLRQIGMMAELYSSDNKGVLPWASTGGGATPQKTWGDYLANYGEKGTAKAGNVRSCPEWIKETGVNNTGILGYGMNVTFPELGSSPVGVGNDAVPPVGARLRTINIRKPSDTVLFADAGKSAARGGAGSSWNLNIGTSTTFAAWLADTRAGHERHTSKANYAMADGSVRLLSPTEAFMLITRRQP